ncbi:MAG: DUF5615 family PIN-like protein [Candidatus Entotheonellia bacterium]
MNELFIALYLDEDVDVLVADLIGARGFRVLTTQAAGQLRSTDAAQLAYAVSQHCALLTPNRVHFEILSSGVTPYRRERSTLTMERSLEAIYEQGVLTPREPPDLREHQRVIMPIQRPVSESPDEALEAWYRETPTPGGDTARAANRTAVAHLLRRARRSCAGSRTTRCRALLHCP